MDDDTDELDEDLDDESLEDEELDEDADELESEELLDVDEAVDEAIVDEDEDEEEEEVPAARKKRTDADEDEDEDEVDPDDVEADLDRILKDRIAAGDEEEDEEEADDGSPEAGERVAAKGADEFTCPTCFLIVHPRQFGRPGNLTCPEGYDPCGAMAQVEAALGHGGGRKATARGGRR